VLFEAPHRVAGTLEDLHASLGDRDVVIAREITKRFETIERVPLATRRRVGRARPGSHARRIRPRDRGKATRGFGERPDAGARALLAECRSRAPLRSRRKSPAASETSFTRRLWR
jgi:hypothetical protein